jgi:hypothetical protein
MFMDTIPAVAVLETCEQGLRKIATDALAAGNYDAARQNIAWAQNIATMAAIARSLNTPVGGGRGGEETAALPSKSKTPFQTRMIQDEYPRFARRDDELVKIGWSKADHKEYQHRAPKRALDAVVAALKRLAPMSPHFTSEDLSPLKDPNGGIFPTYQIFVVLAFLRRLEILVQHGRKGGYTLLTHKPLDPTVHAAWQQLRQCQD